MLGVVTYSHTATSSKFQQPLIAERAVSSKHSIRVHSQNLSQLGGGRQEISRGQFAVYQAAAHLGRDLRR
ncbi:hypothetical protein ABIB54_002480 [Frigoribacterium sp. UYMn621]